MLTQGANHRFRFFAGHLDQHEETGMPLYQGRDIAVLGADQQISFPMAANRSVSGLRRSFADGDSIHDLCSLQWRERRMRRFERRWSMSSFFNTPRAWMNRLR